MRLEFELDPAIIHHIIHSQAGSIGKAVIELVMNSCDAGASRCVITIDQDGFECSDDGKGFASRDDVVRFFGRFGTPHMEGDAKFGVFRVGRGQVMSHASTMWHSGSWQMEVDTLHRGYGYELLDAEAQRAGCMVEGTWYARLSESEVHETLQEIRDLVRYTSMEVQLNGRSISRSPKGERWDFEDEFAYYRVRAEGAVAIYNQGVMVRNDPGHQWGVGGLIVSKKAIGLNVSRTEILRKTCPIWSHINREFTRLAKELSRGLREHRQTESRREQSARGLLSGGVELGETFRCEQTITLLPGKRHVTIEELLGDGRWRRSSAVPISVVEDVEDVPRGEVLAREGEVKIIHPMTLWRFGCRTAAEFKEEVERICVRMRESAGHLGRQYQFLHVPDFVDFAVLKKSFVERTRIADERTELEPETRRAWVALRHCLKDFGGRWRGTFRRETIAILVGDSNVADAWTDGKTYIAIGIEHVRDLRQNPLEAAGTIFALFEHELTHEGDSLDCGHDEAFFQRFHEASLRSAGMKQKMLHLWLAKYTRSLEASRAKQAAGKKVWRERFLVDRASNAREDLGLPRMTGDLQIDPLVLAHPDAVDAKLIARANASLQADGRSGNDITGQDAGKVVLPKPVRRLWAPVDGFIPPDDFNA